MNEGRGPDEVFQALADPTRRALLRSLSEDGPTTLAGLSTRVPVSRQAVAKHLAMLREAGLVEASGAVRGRTYALSAGPLAAAMDWIVDVGADWDARLARLRSFVEAKRP